MERHNGLEQDPEGAFVYHDDAQATIAALQAQLKDMVLRNKILRDRLDLPPERCAFHDEVVSLQARVKELEAIKTPDDAFTYCAYCGEKSPVDEHNEDLAAHIKVCPKHPMRDVESQLTQRTAELEAIETILDIDSGKTTVEKVRDLHRAFKQVWESYQDASNEMFKAQAELERVRDQFADLRKMVAALPKVEGEIEVVGTTVRWGYGHCSCMDTQVEAAAYAALLQHRQGMEG